MFLWTSQLGDGKKTNSKLSNKHWEQQYFLFMEVPAMVTLQKVETHSIPGHTSASANLYFVMKLSNQMSVANETRKLYVVC